MLLEVALPVVAPLISGLLSLGTLLHLLLGDLDLALLVVAHTNHTQTALGTSDDLTASVATSGLLVFFVRVVAAFDGPLSSGLSR